MTPTGALAPVASGRRTRPEGGVPRAGRTWAARASLLSCAALGLVGCGAPGAAGSGAAASLELEGVNTASLTTRERQDWSRLVSELVAPCPDEAMTLERCVETKAPCALCLPAAGMLVDWIEKGRTTDQAREAYRIRYAADAVHPISLDGSPARGAPRPTVTIVEWADFECPFCAASANTLHNLIDQYPDHVRVVFKQYPLSIHQNAEQAARAAVAADMQGKFWPMHDRLFAAQQTGIDRDSIVSLARDIGLDETAFARDWQGPEVRAVIERDRRQADELELKGTPFIYINGRYFDLSLFDMGQDLRSWVQQEIALGVGGRSAAPPSIHGAAASRAPASPTPSATAADQPPAQVDAPAPGPPAPDPASVPAQNPMESSPSETNGASK
jgi:protein-disulfide isomerase